MSVRLFTSTWGTGPPVVLLHGLGASSRYWEAVQAADDGWTAITPDLLGFGRSPSPEDAAYDVESHLGALEPFVPRGAVLVAHSTGGVLAAALAARRPDLRGLLLVALPAYPDAATARREIGGLGLLARLTVEGSPHAKRLCVAMCRHQRLAMAVAPLVIRDLPPGIASDAVRHTWRSYSCTLQRVLVEHRVAPDLEGLGMPVRLLHGRGDRTAPVEHVEALAARLPGVELTVADADHHLPVRRPDLVVTALAGLLS